MKGSVVLIGLPVNASPVGQSGEILKNVLLFTLKII